MKLWEDNVRSAALELVSWLLSTIKDGGGWSVDWVNMVAIDELGALSSQSDSRNHLFTQTLREMKVQGKRTLDDFEAIFEVVLRGSKFREYQSLPTISHVEQYYRFRELSPTDIDAIDTTINCLKKARRKKRGS